MFFDLSIPFLEKDQSTVSENNARRKVAARAMELGYIAVAYDRPFRGVLSDSDRCKIPLFPLSSLLPSPSLSYAASFHRDLIGVPRSSPFRQYTRLTVSVDGAAAAASLNRGNALLRTYDLVAARPMNQIGFDQACQVSEVDLIALDFSQKIPFRLKLPMVEAAIKRGVHFEITYSHLIAEAHVRRQMLSDAKQLVDWTRGKNLIISSSATSVNEIRGPYCIANLSSFLLGLSVERAKSAISRNCRSLVANALRKKDYKEAIRIERILPDEQVGTNGIWFGDWKDWDPISSGEGDLPPLDDITKLFSAASKPRKNYPAIDFFSCANGLPFKDQISGFGENLLSQGKSGTLISCPKKPGLAAASNLSTSTNEAEQKGRLDEVPVENRTSTTVMHLEQQISGFEGDQVSPSVMARLFADPEEPASTDADNGHLQNSNRNNMVSDAVGMPSSNVALKHCILTGETEQNDEVLRAYDIPLQKDIVGPAPSEGEGAIPQPDDVPLEEAFDEIKEKGHGEVVSVESDASMKDVSFKMEEQRQQGSCAADGVTPHMLESGKGRLRGRSLYPAYPLPFKGLFKTVLFKKKVCRLRRRRRCL